MGIAELEDEIDKITQPLKGKMTHKMVDGTFKLPSPVVCRTLIKTSAKLKNKCYSVGWGGDSKHCCVATQSGHVQVYDATQPSGNKGGIQVKLPISAPKVMQCAMSKDTANMKVALGGMDNLINVYNYEGITPKKIKVLEGHEGYISSIHFQDGDSKLLTGSGDGIVILWDIQTKDKVMTFTGHEGDVSGVAVADDNPHVFGTSSTDKTCRMWDKRMPGSVAFRKFTAKYATNCCALMPGAKGILGGCDNASWEYFDVGCNAQVARGKVKKGRCESIALSKSGKVGYLGWDGDTGLVAVDVFIPDNQKKISEGEHTDTVYNCSVSPDGTALATASFDGSAKIWSAAP